MPTPVLLALYEGRLADAEALAREGTLTLAEAAALGDEAAARAALAAGVPPDAASPDGWPPLHLAAHFNRDRMVRLLLAHGAPVAARAASTQGNTALHAALAGAATGPVLEALLTSGASVDDADAYGVRPVHLAASRGNLAALERLKQGGAALGAPLPNGATALDLARERGHADTASWLAAQGVPERAS